MVFKTSSGGIMYWVGRIHFIHSQLELDFTIIFSLLSLDS